ncbi:MAG: hypothetical protein Fur0032_22720 [Terrimicrobiaceae bacterium]
MNAKITMGSSAVVPGGTINGQVEWQLESAPRSAEIRLFWQTRGKGTTDSQTVEVVSWDLPGSHDERLFSFAAPMGPPSFSGTLVSLVWSVELVLEPGGSVSCDFVIAPGGQEIQLDNPEWMEIPDPAPAKSFVPRFS